MKKTNRMIMADAIQQVFLEELSVKQRANLQKVVEYVGDSLLLDSFCLVLFSLRQNKDVTLSNIVSKLTRNITAEVLFKMIEGVVKNKKDIQYLMKLLVAQNKFVVSRITNKCAGLNMRIALNRLFFMIDAKRVNPRNDALRRVLTIKSKTKLIKDSTYIVSVIRPTIELIVREYIYNSEHLEILEVPMKKGMIKYVVKSVAPKEFLYSYMHKTAQNVLNNKISMNIDGQTVARVALEKINAMSFTMDDQFNKTVSDILHTDLFVKLMKGNSADDVSTDAKVSQIRHSTVEGLKFWDEMGKNKFYFTYILDFRGRVSQVGGISAVGNKVGKSMLRSGVKYPLGEHGHDQLLIGLASAMGQDKETFKTRLEWGQKNEHRFINIGRHLLVDAPAAYRTLAKLGADDIFTAASICMELDRLSRHDGPKSTYESDLFIGYDATSSAVQLVGLLMGNEALTEASNVRVGVDTEDRIHDAYLLMSVGMDRAVPKMMGTTKLSDGDAILQQWLNFTLKQKRTIAKPLLMTRLYGSKLLTHIKRSKEAAVSLGLYDVGSSALRRFGVVIAKLFNYAFNREEGYNALRGYEDFVKGIAEAYNSIGVNSRWNVYSNSGYASHQVLSRYNVFEGKQYRVYADGKNRVSRTYNLNILGDCEESLKYEEKYTLDKSKAKSAIAPNYIHSHDALVLYETVLRMKCPMRLTHDCFAAPVGLAHEMQQATTDVYADLFGNNNLKQLERLQADCFEDTGIMVELPVEYNPNGIPTDQIKKAIYAFS